MGKKPLKFEEFKSFLDRFHREVVFLEFNYFDKEKKGTLNTHDFGQLLIAHAKDSAVSQLRKRLRTLKNEENLVKVDDFLSFYRVLQHLDNMQRAVELFSQSSDFTKENFKASAFAAAGIDLPNRLVDVVFEVFDVNDNGRLSRDEFFDVMKKLSTKGLDQPRDLGAWRFFSCVGGCACDVYSSWTSKKEEEGETPK